MSSSSKTNVRKYLLYDGKRIGLGSKGRAGTWHSVNWELSDRKTRKVSPLPATEAHRAVILNPGTRKLEWSASRQGRFTPGERRDGTERKEVGRAQGIGWTF